jgi:hypothetical protein
MEPREEGRDQYPRNPDRLDQWLDAALHEYGSAEPRTGLESRVLANLAAERARRGVRQRWWVYGAVAAMVCAAVAVRLGEMNHKKSAGKIAGKTPLSVQTTGVGNGQSEVKRSGVGAAVERRARPHRAKGAEVAEGPRLSQFPSPRGLSEQEQLLLRYVTESPSEAVLVAKEQAEWRRKMLESRDSSSSTRSENSNQDENRDER